MSDTATSLADFPITRKWPAAHPERLPQERADRHFAEAVRVRGAARLAHRRRTVPTAGEYRGAADPCHQPSRLRLAARSRRDGRA